MSYTRYDKNSTQQSPWYTRGMRRVLIGLAPFIAYAMLLLGIFWAPLAHHLGSIQWDSVGVHFFNIAFSSTLLHQGILPLWTSHIFGGFPQIADMQVALWYPPILLIATLAKFTATKLLAEIALHYFLAASFMFLLARKLKAPTLAAWGLGLAYALGGFMVGHASHVGMMNAATWLPLITALLIHTLERRHTKQLSPAVSRWASRCLPDISKYLSILFYLSFSTADGRHWNHSSIATTAKHSARLASLYSWERLLSVC